MTLLEKFNSMPPGSNFSIFLRDMAEALDGIAANIKALPAYNPATAPAMLPTDIGSWTKAINSANGWGDVLNRMRGMAEAVDNINEWIASQTRYVPSIPDGSINPVSTPFSEQAARRGRPPKAKAA